MPKADEGSPRGHWRESPQHEEINRAEPVIVASPFTSKEEPSERLWRGVLSSFISPDFPAQLILDTGPNGATRSFAIGLRDALRAHGVRCELAASGRAASIGEMLDLVRDADAVVTADSYLAHAGPALGIRTLVIARDGLDAWRVPSASSFYFRSADEPSAIGAAMQALWREPRLSPRTSIEATVLRNAADAIDCCAPIDELLAGWQRCFDAHNALAATLPEWPEAFTALLADERYARLMPRAPQRGGIRDEALRAHLAARFAECANLQSLETGARADVNRIAAYLTGAARTLRALQLPTGELPAVQWSDGGEPYHAPVPLLSALADDALAYVDARSPLFIGRVRDLVPPSFFRDVASLRWGLRLSIASEEDADGTWQLHGRNGAREADVATTACAATALLPGVRWRSRRIDRRHVLALQRLGKAREWSTLETAHALRYLALAGADTTALAARLRRDGDAQPMDIATTHAVARALRVAQLPGGLAADSRGRRRPAVRCAPHRRAARTATGRSRARRRARSPVPGHDADRLLVRRSVRPARHRLARRRARAPSEQPGAPLRRPALCATTGGVMNSEIRQALAAQRARAATAAQQLDATYADDLERYRGAVTDAIPAAIERFRENVRTFSGGSESTGELADRTAAYLHWLSWTAWDLPRLAIVTRPDIERFRADLSASALVYFAGRLLDDYLDRHFLYRARRETLLATLARERGGNDAEALTVVMALLLCFEGLQHAGAGAQTARIIDSARRLLTGILMERSRADEWSPAFYERLIELKNVDYWRILYSAIDPELRSPLYPFLCRHYAFAQKLNDLPGSGARRGTGTPQLQRHLRRRRGGRHRA